MSDEVEIQTWSKIERDSQKTGLREGIHDGRESNFQESFDKGFADGFRNAFKIGQYNGALFSAQKQNRVSSPEQNDLLNSAKTGWCQLCPDNTESKTISEIQTIHDSHISRNIQQLHSRYSKYSNIDLPKV